jgi:hypothetical protein
MKIYQLLSGIDTHLTNEENRFVEHHPGNIKINSLDDHDQWLAQSLVRKGIYTISKDSNILIPNLNEHNS